MTRNALTAADELGCEEVETHEPTTPTEVHLIAYSEPERRTLERVAERIRAEGE